MDVEGVAMVDLTEEVTEGAEIAEMITLMVEVVWTGLFSMVITMNTLY